MWGMKWRFITGVLFFVFVLTGCGVTETSAEVTTTATTTAAVTEMQSVATTTTTTTKTISTETTTADITIVETTTEETILKPSPPITTISPEPTPDNPFKDIRFTADYGAASNRSLYNERIYSYWDGIIVTTGGNDNLLYARIVDSGYEIYIDKNVEHVIFTNGEITYSDGNKNIKVFDLKKGELTFDYNKANKVAAIIRCKNFIAYHNFTQMDDRIFTEIIAIDVNTLEEVYSFTASNHTNLEEGDEYYSEQQMMPVSLNFDVYGMLYFAVLTGQETDGFHKRTIYRVDLETGLSQEVITETSDTPYPLYLPDSVFLTQIDGIYYNDQNGDMIKL
jgi:hypothetical protein